MKVTFTSDTCSMGVVLESIEVLESVVATSVVTYTYGFVVCLTMNFFLRFALILLISDLINQERPIFVLASEDDWLSSASRTNTLQ